MACCVKLWPARGGGRAALVARVAAVVPLALGRRRLAVAALAVALVVVGRGRGAGLGARRVARAALRRRLHRGLARPARRTRVSHNAIQKPFYS